MLRTLKNSPVHFPILETGLLIRNTAEKIQQNDSVPSKMSFLPITLGQPQQSQHSTETERETDREAKRQRGEKGKRPHGCKGQNDFLSQCPAASVNSGGARTAEMLVVKSRASWGTGFLSSKYTPFRWHLAPASRRRAVLDTVNVSGTPQPKGSWGVES